MILLMVSTSVGATYAGSNHGVINTPTAYDWPMFMHDVSHSGAISGPGPYESHEEAASVLGGAVKAAIVASSSYIFLTAGSTLYALNSSTLAKVATKSFSPTTSAPAAVGLTIYIGSGDGYVYSLTADLLTQSFQTNWRYHTGGAVYSSPTVYNGLVFFGSDDQTVYAVNAITGKLAWSFLTGGPVRSSPAVNGTVVAIGSDDGKLYILQESTGKLVRSFTTGGAVRSSPTLVGDIAYFGSNDSRVYAVNTATGVTLWNTATKGAVVASPVLTSDGEVVVGSTDHKVYALSSASGAPLWTVNVGGAVSASAALAEGVHKGMNPTYVPMAYISSSNGEAIRIATDTGSVVWEFSLNGPGVAPVAVAYTKVYVGDMTGGVFELGQLRFSTAVGTFDLAGNPVSVIPPSGTVRLGANTAWGRAGINQTLVSVSPDFGKHRGAILVNATMSFLPGQTPYNLYFDWTYSGLAPGSYRMVVLIEDAHSKLSSSNPRCCGWVDLRQNGFHGVLAAHDPQILRVNTTHFHVCFRGALPPRDQFNGSLSTGRMFEYADLS